MFCWVQSSQRATDGLEIALRAELWLLIAGLRGIARSFDNAVPFGSFVGLLETWTFFCTHSHRCIRASFLQNVSFQHVWVRARHVRPRDSTRWQTYARLKPSSGISGDVAHA